MPDVFTMFLNKDDDDQTPGGGGYSGFQVTGMVKVFFLCLKFLASLFLDGLI